MTGNRPSTELKSLDDDEEGQHMAYNANWMTSEFRDFRAAQALLDEAQGKGDILKFGKKSATKAKKSDLASVDPSLAQELSKFNRIDWKDYSDQIPERAWQMLVRFSREPMHTQAAFCEEDEDCFTSSTMVVLKKVLKERPIYYILTVLDELFKENPRLPRIFKETVGTNLDPFIVIPDLVTREWVAEGRKFRDVLPARACYVLSHFLAAGLLPGSDAMQVKEEKAQREARACNPCMSHGHARAYVRGHARTRTHARTRAHTRHICRPIHHGTADADVRMMIRGS